MAGRKDPRVLICSTQKVMRVPRKKLDRLIRFVARRGHVRLGQVDLAVVTSRQIAAMNRRYLGRGGATDVLAFDLSDGGEPLEGQLVVCGDVAVREGRRRGTGPQRELMLYVVHGLLHLLGYDDARPPGARRMAERQEELLEAFLRG